jgi:hypothetical protein
MTNEELEPIARAIAIVTFPDYRDDARWTRAWTWYVCSAADPSWHVDDLAETRPGIALRQARAAIEAWKATKVITP